MAGNDAPADSKPPSGPLSQDDAERLSSQFTALWDEMPEADAAEASAPASNGAEPPASNGTAAAPAAPPPPPPVATPAATPTPAMVAIAAPIGGTPAPPGATE